MASPLQAWLLLPPLLLSLIPPPLPPLPQGASKKQNATNKLILVCRCLREAELLAPANNQLAENKISQFRRAPAGYELTGYGRARG